MKAPRLFVLVLLVVIAHTGYAQPDELKRLALVIGVKGYKHVAPLQNSLNDARDMSATLKQKGFQVVEVYDPQTKREMKDAIMTYFDLLRENPNSAGMVFYSGHGMQVDGSNYLMPAQANPKIKADLDEECMNMDFIMRAIEQAGNPLNIFVLDACRNNPFSGFYRSAEKGLSMVATPKGSYIVYATKPGSVASDGANGNGLFTSKLLKYLNAEGLSIEQVFKRVASDVAKESNDAQRPWIASDYTGDFYFTPGRDAADTGVPLTYTPTIISDRREESAVRGFLNAAEFGYTEMVGVKVVLIDSMQWASKNLNVTSFANGTKIPESKTDEEWQRAGNNQTPAWCYYQNNPANAELFGKLYNWYAVNDKRKLCPVGWHVPASEEWDKMIASLGSLSATQLKSMEKWSLGKTGSDAYEFAAYPASSRSHKGKFSEPDMLTTWWTSTADMGNPFWANYATINMRSPEVRVAYDAKGAGFSVRCVKD